MTDREEWRDIPGYEGQYQVSDLGRVKSLRRQQPCRTKWGTPTTRLVEERILKLYIGKLGYPTVMLGSNSQTVLVHSLVLTAFVGPRPSPSHQVAHWDGDRANNHLSNLRWATAQENSDDKERHGTHTRGPDHWKARVTAEEVIALRAKREGGALLRELADEYGVSIHTVSGIVHRRWWRHV